VAFGTISIILDEKEKKEKGRKMKVNYLNENEEIVVISKFVPPAVPHFKEFVHFPQKEKTCAQISSTQQIRLCRSNEENDRQDDLRAVIVHKPSHLVLFRTANKFSFRIKTTKQFSLLWKGRKISSIDELSEYYRIDFGLFARVFPSADAHVQHNPVGSQDSLVHFVQTRPLPPVLWNVREPS
jgi:hypothetical protein